MRTVIASVLVLVVVVGCKKDDDPGVEWSAKDAKESIPKIKAAIASKKPGDAMFECAQMANIDGMKQSDTYKAVAAELEALCTHDLQVAMIKVAVEAAEAARKAKPDEQVLLECFSAELATAKDDLVKYKKLDAGAQALLARMQAACPDQKP